MENFLRPGKTHALGDVLSEAPRIMDEEKSVIFNGFQVPYIDAEELIGSYEEDEFFGSSDRW